MSEENGLRTTNTLRQVANVTYTTTMYDREPVGTQGVQYVPHKLPDTTTQRRENIRSHQIIFTYSCARIYITQTANSSHQTIYVVRCVGISKVPTVQ